MCVKQVFFVLQIHQIYTLVVGTMPVIMKRGPAIQ